jgi:hypothetical protein
MSAKAFETFCVGKGYSMSTNDPQNPLEESKPSTTNPPPVFVKPKSSGVVAPRHQPENQWPLIIILLILAVASVWFLTTKVSFSSVPVEEQSDQETYRQTPRPQPGSG